jgi:hypothetical protein
MRSVACHLETDTNQNVIKTDLIIFHSRSFEVYHITFVVNTPSYLFLDTCSSEIIKFNAKALIN